MRIDDSILSEALRAFATGEKCTEFAAIGTLSAVLGVTGCDARSVLDRLARDGLLERRVHPANGFVTYLRPSGRAAQKPKPVVVAPSTRTSLTSSPTGDLKPPSLQTPMLPNARAKRAMEYSSLKTRRG